MAKRTNYQRSDQLTAKDAIIQYISDIFEYSSGYDHRQNIVAIINTRNHKYHVWNDSITIFSAGSDPISISFYDPEIFTIIDKIAESEKEE